jgi:hypothetical protein
MNENSFLRQQMIFYSGLHFSVTPCVLISGKICGHQNGQRDVPSYWLIEVIQEVFPSWPFNQSNAVNKLTKCRLDDGFNTQ